MHKPIITRECVSIGHKWVEYEWTYEEIFEIWPQDDKTELVPVLANRCIELEAELDHLRNSLRDITEMKICRKCQCGANLCSCTNGPKWVTASDHNVAVRRIKDLLEAEVTDD